jgi:hypothetical protein
MAFLARLSEDNNPWFASAHHRRESKRSFWSHLSTQSHNANSRLKNGPPNLPQFLVGNPDVHGNPLAAFSVEK